MLNNANTATSSEIQALRVAVADLCGVVMGVLQSVEAVRSRLDALETKLEARPASDSVRRMKLAVDQMVSTLEEAVQP